MGEDFPEKEEKPMMKRMISLGMALSVLLSLLALPAQAVGTAPTLTEDHVQYMQGFPNGTFRPNTQLTRAQAAQMVVRLLEDPESGLGDCSYEDVPETQWYAPAVTALCRLGLFDDGAAFRPDDIITRAEFVDLLVRLQPEASGPADFPTCPPTTGPLPRSAPLSPWAGSTAIPTVPSAPKRV